MKCTKNTEKGQIVIILLLVMVASLAIGLSIVGRSITEISTSTNSENSSRAFSAAEAGMESILYESSLPGFESNFGPTGFIEIDNTKLTNDATAKTTYSTNMPPLGIALEYPPFGKESFAQFWLADPKTDPPTKDYNADEFDIYFGDPTKNYSPLDANYPAIEVQVISLSNGVYTNNFYFFDSQAAVGSPSISNRANFSSCTQKGSSSDPLKITTNNNTQESLFLCKATVNSYPFGPDPTSYPIMVRISMLFTNLSHPVALQPKTGSKLPFQAKIFDSKGVSGNVQRNLKVFQEISVIPYIFDYALFSMDELRKTQ